MLLKLCILIVFSFLLSFLIYVKVQAKLCYSDVIKITELMFHVSLLEAKCSDCEENINELIKRSDDAIEESKNKNKEIVDNFMAIKKIKLRNTISNQSEDACSASDKNRMQQHEEVETLLKESRMLKEKSQGLIEESRRLNGQRHVYLQKKKQLSDELSAYQILIGDFEEVKGWFPCIKN